MRDVDPEGRPTLGWQVVTWIQKHLVHGPGDVQGTPIRLDDELLTFVLRAYALDPVTGRRVYDEALLSRVKGRAKSELAGMLVCAEALGPVRFSHWDPETGEPIGRRVVYPFIRCLATEEGQAGNTYANVAFMLSEAREQHPEMFAGVDIGRDWQSSTRVFLPGGGEIRPSTASSAAKDGGKESFAVADETHLYVLPETRSMFRTVKFNCGKRKAAEPWMLQTSTMYAPGEESVVEVTHRAVSKGKARRLLFDHRGARRHLELADTAELRSELRYVYGDFADVMDLDRVVSLLLDETVDEADRRRYWLNEEHASSGRFLPLGVWPACAQPEIVVSDGAMIALGFDGSLRQDATALRGCTPAGHLFTLGIWEAPLDSTGRPVADWEVPLGEVDAAVDEAHRRFRVVRGYYDPAWYGSWVATWAARHGKDRVVEWWTNRDAPMARALRSIRTAIVQRELTQDGDPVAARHWANAHRRPTGIKDETGAPMSLMGKERKGSPNKIDVAMADTLAWAARNDALTAGLFVSEPAPATATAPTGNVRVEVWRPTRRLKL
jgi:phage terminase large subunit-like protein